MIAPATQFAGQRATRTQRSVQIADLNLATTAGKAVFDRPMNFAAERVCRDERDLSIQHACKLAVRAGVAEKLAASNTSTQLAARRARPPLGPATVRQSWASLRGFDYFVSG